MDKEDRIRAWLCTILVIAVVSLWGLSAIIQMDWEVYILECSDGTLYTGISNNLPSRIEKHNSGNGAKYTKNRIPVALVYKETLKNKSESLKREIEIKRLTRSQKLDLIDSIDLATT